MPITLLYEVQEDWSAEGRHAAAETTSSHVAKAVSKDGMNARGPVSVRAHIELCTVTSFRAVIIRSSYIAS